MQNINIQPSNFSLTEFFISLILMIVFLSFFMEGIRFFFTSIEEMISPTSKDNQTVFVLNMQLPKWLEKIILVFSIIATIIIVRGMLNFDLNFKLSSQGFRAMFEMGIAMGFLTLGYTIAGPMIARKITMKILKKYKFSDMDVLTDEEYIASGKSNGSVV